MDELIIYTSVAAVIGLLLGALIVLISSQRKVSAINVERSLLQQEVQQADMTIDQLRHESRELQAELKSSQAMNTSYIAQLSEIKVRLEETQFAAAEKQHLLESSEARLTTQFENLANRIFEHSGQRFSQQNKQSLDALLVPLKEQLYGFRRQVQESFVKEATERHTLTHEIRTLQQLNESMAKEAVNLTRALKGDNKTQGNWGEVVLSRVLEASGLREGHEYETQVSINTEQGKRLQPDIIVRLPHEKDVVIDSKMALVAYERYFNSDDEAEKEVALREHILAIRNHIRQLSSKDYHQLPGLRSLDYVLLFIPVEPAFLLAIDREPELISEALKHNIMLVSPTTLLVALRTITNLWRYENQNQNAQLIAQKATKLYDKMRLFVDDMRALGNSLDKAQNTYQGAMNKLSEGRGNLISQAESFRELGVEVKKQINPSASLSLETKKAPLDAKSVTLESTSTPLEPKSATIDDIE